MNPPAARPQPAVPAPATPVAVHCLNWQQALLDLPASATAAQRDAVVASWAQRCWHDLCAALPQQQHVVLAYTDAPRTDGGGGAVYVLLRK